MHNVAIRTGTEEHRLIVSGAITFDGIRRVMVSSTCVSPDRLLTLLPELDDGLHEYCPVFAVPQLTNLDWQKTKIGQVGVLAGRESGFQVFRHTLVTQACKHSGR